MDVSLKTGSGLFSTSNIRFLSVPSCIKILFWIHIDAYLQGAAPRPGCVYTYRIDEGSFISSRHSQPCRAHHHYQKFYPALLHPAALDPHIYTYIVKDRPSSIFISIQREVLRSSHAFPYISLMSAHLPPGSFSSSSHPSRARTQNSKKRARLSRVGSWNRHEMILSSESTCRKKKKTFLFYIRPFCRREYI